MNKLKTGKTATTFVESVRWVCTSTIGKICENMVSFSLKWKIKEVGNNKCGNDEDKDSVQNVAMKIEFQKDAEKQL